MAIFLSVIMAIAPVAVWLRIIGKGEEDRSLYIKTFIFGTLTLIPPFIVLIFFRYYPQYDIYEIIQANVTGIALAALLTNMVVGVTEEIGKNLIVRIIDKRHPEYLQTLVSALKLSVCAGLGFAFAENILYFYRVSSNEFYGVGEVINTVIFRSIITMCGHMVFSGIFGFYFGIGKFAADITEQARWEGKQMRFARFLSRITGRMTFQVVREMKNIWGLILAMGMHALFNASIDLGEKVHRGFMLVAVAIVLLGAVHVYYLMKTKSGRLLFSFVKRRESNMAAKDEDVVLELVGMWYKEGKLKEVIEICDRLLQRDPDNNVVKIFKAKAMDDQNLKRLYSSLKAVMGKTKIPLQNSTTVVAPALGMQDEKVVVELMNTYYKKGNYKEVLDVANRLLARNPNSQGAKLLLQKALDEEKMEEVFTSLKHIFGDD